MELVDHQFTTRSLDMYLNSRDTLTISNGFVYRVSAMSLNMHS
jgi:hypothetical protein